MVAMMCWVLLMSDTLLVRQHEVCCGGHGLTCELLVGQKCCCVYVQYWNIRTRDICNDCNIKEVLLNQRLMHRR